MKKLLLYSLLILVSAQAWAGVAGIPVVSDPFDTVITPEWDARIYPNPNNGIFSVMFSNNSAAIKVVVFNVIGEKVFELTALGDHGAKMDLSKLEKGLYFVQFIDEKRSEVLTRRMFIE